MKLNPNHPVTRIMDDEFMHKIAAILVMQAGGRATVTSGDIHALDALFGGETPTLAMASSDEKLEFWLLPKSQADALASEAGGLPQ